MINSDPNIRSAKRYGMVSVNQDYKVVARAQVANRMA